MCNCLEKWFRGLALAASIIFGLGGVAVAVGAGYLLYNSGLDLSQMELLGATTLKLILGSGFAMVLFSIISSAGLVTRKKGLIIPSILILLCVMLVHAFATVGVFNRRALMSGIRETGLGHETRIVTKAAAKSGKTFLASLKHDYMLLASGCKKAKDADVYMSDSVDGKQFELYSAYQCSKAQFIGNMASPSARLMQGESEWRAIQSCVAEDATERDDLNTLAMYCMARHEFADYVNAVASKQGAILVSTLVLEFLVMIGMCFAAFHKPKVERRRVVAGRAAHTPVAV